MKKYPKTCAICWADFEWIYNAMYCSKECYKQARLKQNAEAAREKRKKVKICISCWAEFIDWSNKKNCEECFKKKRYCSCWNLKRTEYAEKCTECLNKKVCELCWTEFIGNNHTAKYCSKECAAKAKLEIRKQREYPRSHLCKSCWLEFATRQWRNEYCDDCNIKRRICPNCWWPKAEDHEHCNKCKNLSHSFICKGCGGEFPGIKCTMYCSKCRPKCLYCWWEVSAIHNGCCSQSCAMKYKWEVTSKEKMVKHLHELVSWKYNKWKSSSANKLREKLFDDNWIEYEKKNWERIETLIRNNLWLKSIGDYTFWDFRIGNILIDINPTMTHNISIEYRKWNGLIPLWYHRDKTILAEEAWYHPIHIFDRDDKAKIIDWIKSLVGKKKRLYNDSLRIVQWSEAAKFCEENHLQWATSATVWYGLYKKNSLISLMWFKKNKERELVRFCNLRWTYIAHWAEKLFNRFLEDYNPDTVISFSDATKHTGKLYDALWFSCSWNRDVSYWRANKDWSLCYRRRLCQKKNIHNLKWFNGPCQYIWNEGHPFWQQTESEIMVWMWYVKVCDSGMRKHIRTKH